MSGLRGAAGEAGCREPCVSGWAVPPPDTLISGSLIRRFLLSFMRNPSINPVWASLCAKLVPVSPSCFQLLIHGFYSSASV